MATAEREMQETHPEIDDRLGADSPVSVAEKVSVGDGDAVPGGMLETISDKIEAAEVTRSNWARRAQSAE
ncbi:hypothetical protein CCR96_03460 [Halochromatium roseum]|nr:hypothetical protein [Halochromatium roseum]